MRVRTEIVIETYQAISIRGLGSRVQAWCSRCAAPGEMLTPDEAAVLREVTRATIARWLDGAIVHRGETSDGQVVVCLASLFEVPDNEEVN